MIKKSLIFICFFLLSNCSVPGSAFLGPVFTGAKTGSVYQASLSYTSNQIINGLKENQIFKNDGLILSEKPDIKETQEILLSYKVNKIVISDVLEPEPLP